MALVDANIYALRIPQTEQMIVDKRGQLAASSDPLVIATIQRSLNALEDMLVILRKTTETLEALQRSQKNRTLKLVPKA